MSSQNLKRKRRRRGQTFGRILQKRALLALPQRHASSHTFDHRYRLTQNSGVFRGMFESIDPLSGTSQVLDQETVPIHVSVSAETLARFLDLLGIPDDIQIEIYSVAPNMFQTHQLYRLADRFDVERIKGWTERRMKLFPAWHVLHFAGQLDDLELARTAIRRLPLLPSFGATTVTGEKTRAELSTFWDDIGRSRPSWQVTLLRQLFPTIKGYKRKDGKADDLKGHGRNAFDLKSIANAFAPQQEQRCRLTTVPS